MDIDYTKVIRDSVEPKLAYHGFKYNEEKSHPPTGHYSFTRTYWGKSQAVYIGRVNYDLEALANLGEGDDSPEEVPAKSLLIREPGYRQWLSTRYVVATASHEGGSTYITPTEIGWPAAMKQVVGVPFEKAGPLLDSLYREHIYWKYRDEASLRRSLRGVVEFFLSAGLDWFDEQVAEIRRYHAKLDARRNAESERRNRLALKNR
jgi:hypothetical protein